MNQISEVITTLIHYKVVVRDTLEYTIQKDKYDMRPYNERKRAVLIELNEKTPLKSILDNSKENGEKLEKTIRDFYDEVYGDNSTILKPANDGLRVDHNQHLPIFKGVVMIHENVEGMIRALIQDAKNKKVDVAEVEKVDKDEERFYRAIAFLTLTNQLIRFFNDYNQARRENKGEESATSRFINNDINEIVKLIYTVRGSSRLTDERYMDVQDKVLKLIEYMTGRRDLPAGQSFGNIFKDVNDTLNGYVREVEPAFRNSYVPLMNELIQQARANGNKIGGNAPAAEAKPAQEVEGKPTEIDPGTGLPKA